MDHCRKTILVQLLFCTAILLQSCEDNESDATPKWYSYHLSHVTNITADKRGHVWVSRFGATVFEYVNGSWRTWDHASSNGSLPTDVTNNGFIFSSCLDSSGRIWFATDSGIVMTDGIHWTNYDLSDSSEPLSGNNHFDICCDKYGNLWAASYGILKYDGKNWTRLKKENTSGLIPNNYIDKISSDLNGNIWFTLLFVPGVFRYNNTEFINYTLENTNGGLAGDTIRSLACDYKGNMIFGTTEGFSIYDGTSWKKYSVANSGLPSDTIRVITIDHSDGILLGTENGMARFAAGEITPIVPDKSVTAGKYVSAIAVDPEGNQWFGFGDTEDILLYGDD